MLRSFLLFLTSSQLWMGILHTQSDRGLHSGPKTTRDTPKVARFCFVCLLMLGCDPPIEILLLTAVLCSFLPHLRHGWAYRIPMASKMPRKTPTVATLFFVHLLMAILKD